MCSRSFSIFHLDSSLNLLEDFGITLAASTYLSSSSLLVQYYHLFAFFFPQMTTKQLEQNVKLWQQRLKIISFCFSKAYFRAFLSLGAEPNWIELFEAVGY